MSKLILIYKSDINSSEYAKSDGHVKQFVQDTIDKFKSSDIENYIVHTSNELVILFFRVMIKNKYLNHNNFVLKVDNIDYSFDECGRPLQCLIYYSPLDEFLSQLI